MLPEPLLEPEELDEDEPEELDDEDPLDDEDDEPEVDEVPPVDDEVEVEPVVLPPVEVEVEPVVLPPFEVEVELPVLPPFDVEVELPVLPPLEVEVEPLLVVVEVMMIPLEPPELPPKNPPKKPPKPPPKPPPEPPITVTPPPLEPAKAGSGASGCGRGIGTIAICGRQSSWHSSSTTRRMRLTFLGGVSITTRLPGPLVYFTGALVDL